MNDCVYCNCHGCTNKATVLHLHKEFTNNDGLSKWDVFVNCCDDHFDSLHSDIDTD